MIYEKSIIHEHHSIELTHDLSGLLFCFKSKLG